jgi:hypothetical protein
MSSSPENSFGRARDRLISASAWAGCSGAFDGVQAQTEHSPPTRSDPMIGAKNRRRDLR